MLLDQLLNQQATSNHNQAAQIALTGFRSYITGQDILFQAADLLPYLTLARDYMEELRPVGIRETQLAQRIIDTNWKLNRLDALEKALVCHLTVGEASLGNHGNEERSDAIISEAHAWERDSGGARSLDLLSKLEDRLDRRMTAVTREFERLQDKRLARAHDVDVFDLERCNAYQFYLHEIPSAAETDQALRDQRLRQYEQSHPKPKVATAA